MRNLIKAAFAVIIATMAFSCTKENQEVVVGNSKATVDVCIDGTIEGYSAQEETKVTAQTVIRILWQGDEAVYAYEGTKYLGKLTATKGDADGTYAKLSGTITAPTAGKTVTLVCSPQFSDVPAVSEGKISLDLSLQDEAEVPFLIYGMLPATTASAINDAVVKFSLATSVYKCNCAGLTHDSSISKAIIGEVNTCCILTLSDTAEPVVGGSAPGSITRSAGFAAADERAIFSVALAKTDAGTSRTITIYKGGLAQEASFANTSFGIAKSYNATFAFKKLPENVLPGVYTIGIGKQVYFTNGNLFWDGDAFEFEANQYDFPTSWDASHVGHFFWSKDARVACADNYDTANETYGVTLKVTDLLFTNAFAVAGTNSLYRSLSTDEWKYLLNDRENASQKFGWATVCGKNGLIILPDSFSDPKTNSTSGGPAFLPGSVNEYTDGDAWNAMEAAGALFLPEAGRRHGDRIFPNFGEYLTSTCSSTNSENSYNLYFDNDGNIDPEDHYTRNNAGSIRLVTDVTE